jgi:transcription elongation factor Elf1
VTYKLLDSRLLRQRLETFLNCPRGGLEVIALDGPLRPRKYDIRLSDLEGRFTCSVCGHHCADIRPDWQSLT